MSASDDDRAVEAEETAAVPPSSDAEEAACCPIQSGVFNELTVNLSVDPMQFTIHYNDHDFDDLYRKLEEKFRSLRIPRDKVWYMDKRGKRDLLKNIFDVNYLVSVNPDVKLHAALSDEVVKKEPKHFVSLTLRRTYPHQFVISYEDKEDLFRKFNEELDKRNITHDLYWIDSRSRKRRVNTPESLGTARFWSNMVELHSKEIADDLCAWKSVYEPSGAAADEKAKQRSRRRSSGSSTSSSSHNSSMHRRRHHHAHSCCHPRFPPCIHPFGGHMAPHSFSHGFGNPAEAYSRANYCGGYRHHDRRGHTCHNGHGFNGFHYQ